MVFLCVFNGMRPYVEASTVLICVPIKPCLYILVALSGILEVEFVLI